MAQLDEKLQLTLDEGRILILGLQVLLGFQYNAVLHPAFEKLAPSSQYLHIAGAALLLFMLALLLWVPAFHMIVMRGELSERLNSFSNSIMRWALLPFAISVGVDLYILTDKLGGSGLGIAIGAGFALIALFFWFGIEEIARANSQQGRSERRAMSQERGKSPSSPQDKLDKKSERS